MQSLFVFFVQPKKAISIHFYAVCISFFACQKIRELFIFSRIDGLGGFAEVEKGYEYTPYGELDKVTNIVLDCYPGKNLITNDRNTIDKICANINDARLTCIGYGSGSAEEDIAICIFYEDGSKPKGDIIQLKPDGNVIINNFRYNNTGTPIDYDFLKSLLDNKEDTQP